MLVLGTLYYSTPQNLAFPIASLYYRSDSHPILPPFPPASSFPSALKEKELQGTNSEVYDSIASAGSSYLLPPPPNLVTPHIHRHTHSHAQTQTHSHIHIAPSHTHGLTCTC